MQVISVDVRNANFVELLMRQMTPKMNKTDGWTPMVTGDRVEATNA